MRKRFAVYILLAIPLAIFTWYSASIIVVTLAMWISSALSIAIYEVKQSGKPAKSAIAVTTFWLVGLVFYSFYWAGIVFLGYGGEQLLYLRVGISQNWLIQDLQFYQHTMLSYVVRYGWLALVAGPLLGVATGWLLIQSRLSQYLFIQKFQQ